MTKLELKAINAVIKHLMADAEDPNWSWEGGMDLLVCLSRQRQPGGKAALKKIMEEQSSCRPGDF